MANCIRHGKSLVDRAELPFGQSVPWRVLPEGGGLRVEEVPDVHSVRQMGLIYSMSAGGLLLSRRCKSPFVPNGGHAAVCRRQRSGDASSSVPF